MNNLKARSEALLINYPGTDLDLKRVKDYIPTLYSQYKGAIGNLSAAVVIDDESLYSEAEKNYIEVFNSFGKSNMNLCESSRLAAEAKRQIVVDRLNMLNLRIATAKNAIQTLEKTIESQKAIIIESNIELQKMEGEI